jgi:hypothetical protein
LQEIKDFILNLINYFPFGRLVSGYYLLQKNHLTKSGWKKSAVRRLPVDRNGEVLPWMTYSIIYFLERKLQKSFSVFEYGSGNSTLWFSQFVNQVTSIEHDHNWYQKMESFYKQVPNIQYSFRQLESGTYQNEILRYHKAFDIIVIDGRERIACSLNSLNALKDNGVVIWDNSDREEYSEGYNFFLENGFKRLDFYGMGPISAHAWCTSIFYRKNNCLNI